ncbi:MAG: hypothetical protein RIA64_07555 [Rhodospirillales bacterium]
MDSLVVERMFAHACAELAYLRTAVTKALNERDSKIERLRAEHHELYSALRAIRDTDWSDDPEWARDYATEVCVKMEKTSGNGTGEK